MWAPVGTSTCASAGYVNTTPGAAVSSGPVGSPHETHTATVAKRIRLTQGTLSTLLSDAYPNFRRELGTLHAVTDNRSTVELDQATIAAITAAPQPTVTEDRQTQQLEKIDSRATHRYSVRRATTNDERSQLIEHVAVGRVAAPPAKSRWRVELGDKTVTLRNEQLQVELPIEDARKIAEAILRHR